VFSQEFIDFLMTRQNLTAIEVANRLGIEKMVSGSVLVVGDTVRVEARIVDVGSGILEGAYVATGEEHDFLAVEQHSVSGVMAQVHLELPAEDERRLSARPATDVKALRRLREVEQGAQPAVPPNANPTGVPDGESWLWRHVGPRAAHADEAQADVRTFLEAYRRGAQKRGRGAPPPMYSPLPTPQPPRPRRVLSPRPP